ncbi:MAG: hypothetical protein KDB65_03575 [Calditrichaeota bacterium]|nr:hypothetical protein [Calditrichota bacterium]MCB9368742.1 hypothetical protein [Calditrichota bacterium]
MFRLLSTLLVLIFGTLLAQAATNIPHHALIRVFGHDAAHEKLLLNDDRLDILPKDEEPGVLVAALPGDFDYLQSRGYGWDVVHQDLEEFYARRLASNDHLDLMGGYKTYSEINAALDVMHANYPNITTAKFSIGQTLEGREIYCIKISDNPDVDEDEIELFYNALHHAREPAAMEVLFLFMDQLTSQYGIDPDLTYLVDNREFYFVPCVNVDGYVYNETTNSNGGGMWRKNRRNNGTSYGVDLNRNYGFNWGYDNSGSSPTPSSETYRGIEAFSEPETQVMRDFVNSRNFIVAMNYHTYSNLILYPWGVQAYEGGFCPDNDIFHTMADSMRIYIQQVNGANYTIGPPWAVLYGVNGDANDWCYGEQTTKPKIFSFTTEVGGPSDGFWPPQNRIAPLAQENLPANIFVARYAENLIPPDYQVRRILQNQDEQSGNGNGVVEPGELMSLTFTLKNTGAQNLGVLSGTLTTSTPNVSVTNGVTSWPATSPGDSADNSSEFVLSVAGGFSSPGAIACQLHLTSGEGLDTTLSVTAVVGSPSFFDDVESGDNGWISDGLGTPWHVSTRQAVSPTHSWYSGSESTGLYSASSNIILTSPEILLGDNAVLTFSQRYLLEFGYDYGFVELIDAEGTHQIAGPYTGSSGGFQTVSIPLTQYAPGSMIQIQFRQVTDVAVEDEGWYVDDIYVGPPPNISTTPTSVSVGVAPDDIVEQTVVVENSGGSDLVYSVMFQNGTAVTDTGGPDAFGYRWQDSNDPCGPIYSWLPISNQGTQLTWGTGEGDQSRGPFALPFDFPFYGQEYSQLWVNANGWISFVDGSSQAYLNESLPSSNAPAAAIFPWWDDLKPQDAGSNVRFWENGVDSVAVHFENVHAGTSPNQGTYNFQLLLTARGEARVFYGDMGTIRLTSATIGIQNADKTVGLTALNNQAGIANFESRRFALGPRWVSVFPTSGIVAPNSVDTLRLSFLGAELCGDPSLSGLLIMSNDPDNSPLTIPIEATSQVQLPAPLDLTILPDGDDIQLQWAAVPGASTYQVEYFTEFGGLSTIVGTPATNSFTHVNVLQTYAVGYYSVRALP